MDTVMIAPLIPAFGQTEAPEAIIQHAEAQPWAPWERSRPPDDCECTPLLG